MRIYFDKLLNGYYPIEIELEMINWFLKTGNKYDEYTSRWNKDGVAKQMFDFSANSCDSGFPFPIVCNNFIGNGSFSYNVLNGFIQNCLFNAILKEPTMPVKKWREAEKIELGKYRILDFNTDYPETKHHEFENTYWALQKLQQFIGFPLKKELFQPDRKERIEPKIINVKFYTNGNGYRFEYVFSFSNLKYESGWSNCISQQEGESIPCFINRIFNEIDCVSFLA